MTACAYADSDFLGWAVFLPPAQVKLESWADLQTLENWHKSDGAQEWHEKFAKTGKFFERIIMEVYE